MLISICSLRKSIHLLHCSLVHHLHSSSVHSSLICINNPITRYNEEYAEKKWQSVYLEKVVNIRLIDTSRTCSSLCTPAEGSSTYLHSPSNNRYMQYHMTLCIYDRRGISSGQGGMINTMRYACIRK